MSHAIRGPAAGPSLVGVAAVGAATAVLQASRPVLSGVDPFWHWDMGRRILERGLIREDPYSFLTTGREWVLNQWGTELVVGLARGAGGVWLVAVLASLLVGAAVLLTGLTMWRRSPSLITLGLLVLVVASMVTNWSLRGNLFTFLLLPLLLVELRRNPGPRPWVVVILLVVWANMHAAFLLGVGLVLLDTTARILVAASRQDEFRRGLRLVLAALAAGMVTPYGPRFLGSVIALSLTGARGTGITEWGPTAITRPAMLPFTLLVAVVLVAVAITATRNELPDVVLVVAGALFGISALRNVAAGAIVLGVVGAPHLRRAYVQLRDHPTEQEAPRPSRIDGALFIVLWLVGLLLVPVVVPRSNALEHHTQGVPLGLIHDLDALERPARVFTTTRWAAAVASLTGDHVTIAVDGRLELFVDEEYDDYRTVESADPGWRDIVDDWCLTDIVVPAESTLSRALEEAPQWEAVAQEGATDPSAMWLQRRRERPLEASC